MQKRYIENIDPATYFCDQAKLIHDTGIRNIHNMNFIIDNH